MRVDSFIGRLRDLNPDLQGYTVQVQSVGITGPEQVLDQRDTYVINHTDKTVTILGGSYLVRSRDPNIKC